MDSVTARLEQAMGARKWVSADMKLRDWTPGRIAHLIGVSPSTAQRWVKGEATPTAEQLDELGSHLGVRTEWLLHGGDVPRIRAERESEGPIVARPLHMVTGPMGRRPPPPLVGEFAMYRLFWNGFREQTSDEVSPGSAEWWWESINPAVRLIFGEDLALRLGRHPIASHEQRGRFAGKRLLLLVLDAMEWDDQETRRSLTESRVSGRAWTGYLVRAIGEGFGDTNATAMTGRSP